jgi:hypothetical protein
MTKFSFKKFDIIAFSKMNLNLCHKKKEEAEFESRIFNKIRKDLLSIIQVLFDDKNTSKF